MQAAPSWLSLKVQARIPLKKAVLIAIPKKAVPLATTRNRIKRLLREATSKDLFFHDAKKSFLFRVLASPKALNLKETLSTIERLK